MKHSSFNYKKILNNMNTKTDFDHIQKFFGTIVQNQHQYWQNYLSLYQTFNQNLDNDNNNNNYKEHPLFNFIQQSYVLMTQQLQLLVDNFLIDDTSQLSKKIKFYIKQYIDAIAPNNFIMTNPEVLQATLSSNGENLINGFKEFLNDLQKNQGRFNVRMTDLEFFQLGKNIATTPGKVIYQNEIMQLIQYEPMSVKVNRSPILIIPPWINKYYVLDLRPQNSLVRWLLEQEQTVFLISWVNPDQRHANKDFSDYLLEGPLAALNIIKKIIGSIKINVLGYCVGGTLLACLLGYLNHHHQSPILSATYLTTLIDFSFPGDLGIFIDESQINALEKEMQVKGYLDGHVLMSTFSLLRANDLIWKNLIDQYLKGQKPAPFDLLYWNADPTNIPEKLHSFFLRQLYLNNLLIKPNAIKIENTAIDLRKISIPSYFLATFDDHIVPWQSCYKGLQFMGGNKTFVLADSGHVAGVVNSPAKKKYGYRINERLYQDPLEWFDLSTHIAGSWWSHWLIWLNSQSKTKKVPARKIDESKFKIIEDAPGSYARLRLL